MVENILIKTDRGVITDKDLERYISEYRDTLPNKDKLETNISCFCGLLHYIYIRYLKQIIDKGYRNDYVLLDSIFDNIYLPLIYKFGFTVSIYSFCILIGKQQSYIAELYKGITDNGSTVNKNTLDIIKKWYSFTEQGLANRTMETNSIGSIFLLKSKFGYIENQTLRLETVQNSPVLSIEQLDSMDADTEQTTTNSDSLPQFDDI